MNGTITERLISLGEEKYADFQAKLIPDVPREKIIGVRVPELRKLAKELSGTPEADDFVRSLPHEYLDENMLHCLIISAYKDYGRCIAAAEEFLPYVDNWAVCDIMSPKVFAKHKAELIEKIREWTASPLVYTCRFGIEMLMSHYLDSEFREEYLNIPASVHSGEYYVRMMVAWFFATALTKQWDGTIPYIEGRRLDAWIHNKTIQKARETYRIPQERKEYLKSLKI